VDDYKIAKLSLYMSQRLIEKVEVQIHSSETSKQDGSDMSGSRFGRLNLGKRFLQYPFNIRKLGSRAGLHLLEKNKTLAATGIRTPNQPLASIKH
jgi:hypothetical protein